MTRTLATSVAVVLLAACSPELDVPAGAQVTCGSDADCPEGWTCRASLGRCLQGGGDEVPPAVVAGSVQLAHETCGPFQPIEVTFTVSEELAQPPTVLVGAPTQPGLALASQSGLTYTFTYTPPSEAAAPSGNWPVIADLVDRTGNRAQGVSLASVTLDHTPPDGRRARRAAPFPVRGSSRAGRRRGSWCSAAPTTRRRARRRAP